MCNSLLVGLSNWVSAATSPGRSAADRCEDSSGTVRGWPTGREWRRGYLKERMAEFVCETRDTSRKTNCLLKGDLGVFS